MISNFKIPRLFRFRVDSDSYLDPSGITQICGSSNITFNDCFECMPCFEIKKISKLAISNSYYKYLKELLLNMPIENFADKYRKYLIDFRHDPDNKDKGKELFEIVLSKLSMPMNESNPFFTNVKIHKLLADVAIACFCESWLTPLMWGHYSDSGRGICLEYNFNKVDFIKTGNRYSYKENYLLGKVYYSCTKPTASKAFLDYLFGTNATHYIDILRNKEMLNAVYTKNSCWQYEKEWRLVTCINNNSSHCKITELKPVAIFLGPKMTRERVTKYFNFCKNNKIKCYKTFANYSSIRYEMFKVPVEEYLSLTPIAEKIVDKNVSRN